MADDRQGEGPCADDKTNSAVTEKDESGETLESFIREHYELQKEEGKMNSTEQIDDERTKNFFARAIGESQRMSGEVAKSNQKLDRIHAELGVENIAAWRTEHAAEVLEPHQLKAVEAASHPP